MPRSATATLPGNLLFSAMSEETRARVRRHCREVDLARGQVLCEAGSIARYVYFPVSCVISLVAVAESGQGVETAIVGRDGAYGFAASWLAKPSFARSLVQISGAAARIGVADFRREFNRSENLRHIVAAYVETILAQAQQGVLCNALHNVEARLARWLLMIGDRVDREALPLTQEFLAGMLAANRGTVTLAARALQAAGLIRYTRGSIVISHRRGLEAAACECYRAINRHSAHLLQTRIRHPGRTVGKPTDKC